MSHIALTELERRVLGHLPAWAANEKAHIRMEGGKATSIRTYNLADFTERLTEDPNAVGVDANGDVRHATEPEAASLLGALVDRGLAERDDREVPAVKADGEIVAEAYTEARWRMTEAGFHAITGPEKKPDQLPGPVAVPLNPAHGTLDTNAAVES